MRQTLAQNHQRQLKKLQNAGFIPDSMAFKSGKQHYTGSAFNFLISTVALGGKNDSWFMYLIT
uniref:Uncharacterized protein n=1 Tax=Anguilla anguilla TaxID=7936 RepID=A0A0E9UZ60_ANGAN